jgi:hypothetical protein
MDKTIYVSQLDNYIEFVNQFSMIAQDYLDAIDNNESVVIDFQFNNQVDATCSQNLFGRLLIHEKLPNVLCKNINSQPNVVRAIFEGILHTFQETYPQGIQCEDRHILIPQIEMFDPSGDKVYSLVKLSDEDYEGIKK